MKNNIEGCLLGCAVGDSIGLPFEGIAPVRLKKMLPDALEHRFLMGRGMISDDTEHLSMVAQALIVSAGDAGTSAEYVETFTHSLSWKFRWWLAGFPAGTGWATLRSLIKLWIGFGPSKSGVFSAGNGPSMRSAVLGVHFKDNPDPDILKRFVKASTCITHTDPKAFWGAYAVAIAATLASAADPVSDCRKILKKTSIKNPVRIEDFIIKLKQNISASDEFWELLETTEQSINIGENAQAFCERLGFHNGVSGYIYHTLPVVIHCWIRHQNDFRAGITEIVKCGGDTDTTAAILGAVIGAGVGIEGIPATWMNGMVDYPRSVGWLKQVAVNLADSRNDSDICEVPLNIPALMIRNIFFMLVVLGHGFRRLLPVSGG